MIKKTLIALIIIISYEKNNYDREILCFINNVRVHINR